MMMAKSEAMAIAGQIVAAFGAFLVLFGGFYAMAGRPAAKETPYLGFAFPGRVTTALGHAAPAIWRIGALMLGIGLVLQRV